MDKQRIATIKTALSEFIATDKNCSEEHGQTNESVNESINQINEHVDVEQFIKANGKNYLPDPPVNYEPYDSSDITTPKSSKMVKKRRNTTTAQLEFMTSSPQTEDTPTKATAMYDFVGGDSSEISFAFGDTIHITKKVVKDALGWMEGWTVKGRVGLFPANYVEIVYSKEVLCVAVFDFEARYDNELSIKAGELLTIISEGEGWIRGKNDRGQIGLIPTDFVYCITNTETQPQTTQSLSSEIISENENDELSVYSDIDNNEPMST